MTTIFELEKYLNDYLNSNNIKDYCPNGLQIEGNEKITKIVTGVTASQALIDKAVVENADLLLVHHGFFWKNELYPIRGMKHKRIKALINNNINLMAYHLPLDVHPVVGNNQQLGQLLNVQSIEPLAGVEPEGIVMKGHFDEAISVEALSDKISTVLNRKCLAISNEQNNCIRTVAWCTGGGQGYAEIAAEQGIDAFISGEVSEQTTHIAREMGIHYFAAGHHATERYGIKALGEHLAEKFSLSVNFIDIDNPA